MTFSSRKHALTAGLSLNAMALAAGYAYGYVYSSMVVPDNPALTLENIRSSPETFVGGVVGWIVIFFLDILVAWGLYHFLKEVHPGLSLATALVRIVYALVLGAALLHLFPVADLAQSTPSATRMMHELKAFESLWSQGLILFGVHLCGLGILTLRARHVPALWGGLLLFAGLSYGAIHLAKELAPAHLNQIVRIETVLSLPMALSEIGLAFWLIVRGGRTPAAPSTHG